MNRFLKLFIAGVLLVLAGSQAGAECRYFRVKYKLLRCAVDKNPKPTTPALDAWPTDDPALTTDPAQKNVTLATVRCECDYTLSGSAPICDVDRSEEHTGLDPTTNPQALCPRGADTCDEICPRTITD